MQRVIIESPFMGKDQSQLLRNIDYARLCVRDSIIRGEAPFASHLLYTQPTILSDDIPDERTLGMECGFQWIIVAHLVAVYTDNGISKGMDKGIERAKQLGKTIVYRSLYDNLKQQSS